MGELEADLRVCAGKRSFILIPCPSSMPSLTLRGKKSFHSRLQRQVITYKSSYCDLVREPLVLAPTFAQTVISRSVLPSVGFCFSPVWDGDRTKLLHRITMEHESLQSGFLSSLERNVPPASPTIGKG